MARLGTSDLRSSASNKVDFFKVDSFKVDSFKVDSFKVDSFKVKTVNCSLRFSVTICSTLHLARTPKRVLNCLLNGSLSLESLYTEAIPETNCCIIHGGEGQSFGIAVYKHCQNNHFNKIAHIIGNLHNHRVER
jgi:hypothetical protein